MLASLLQTIFYWLSLSARLPYCGGATFFAHSYGTTTHAKSVDQSTPEVTFGRKAAIRSLYLLHSEAAQITRRCRPEAYIPCLQLGIPAMTYTAVVYRVHYLITMD